MTPRRSATLQDLWVDPGPDAALFLDVDGTLLDLAPTPESVVIPDDLVALVARLTQLLDGALALVSGRSIAQLDGFFAPYRFSAGAQHGAEMRLSTSGHSDLSRPDPALDVVRARVATFPTDYPGVIVEDKGASIAVHFRQVPAAEGDLRQILTEVLSGQHALEILPAKLAFDIKLRGLTKGTAVQRFMSASPFAGRRPIFIGDDVTDRFGMAAAQAAGGYAIQVGPTPLQHAEIVEDFKLDSPAAARNWLHSFAKGVADRTAFPDRTDFPDRSVNR